MAFKKTVYDQGDEDIYRLEMMSEDGEISMSHAGLSVCDTRYCDTFIRSMNWGGVGTPPQYRRGGLVRQIFDEALGNAGEYGAAVSMMHPFSFSYYRKMGYERIGDRLQCTFPISALDFLPRFPDLVPYNEKYLEAYLKFFNRFSLNRNTMRRRFDAGLVDPARKTFYRGLVSSVQSYLLVENGEVKGSVIYEARKHFDGINRNVSDGLYVHEFAFADRDSLGKLLGFLRMYDGELTEVTFHDLAPIPEVDLTLRHYMHTSYKVIADMGARVLNTEEFLTKNVYPETRGVFTLKVEDKLPDVAGTFRVEYEKGKASVERLSDESDYDVCFAPQPLVKLFYGTHVFTPELLSYTEGVKLNNDASDLLRAFPKRIVGAFEFF